MFPPEGGAPFASLADHANGEAPVSPHRPDGPEDPTEGEPTHGPLQLLLTAWKRKALLALGLVAGLTLAGLYYAHQRPVYQSTSKILVIEKTTRWP
jgi:uncharacterized protein involved in exopolysaccharide biosynthesis